uniref:Amine oxidase n=1 Tax=Locusta migratoria TaxID=7004 RepID=A0A6B9BIU4_LOCMI|nr:amine oxidase [Locusta migratoria]
MERIQEVEMAQVVKHRQVRGSWLREDLGESLTICCGKQNLGKRRRRRDHILVEEPDAKPAQSTQPALPIPVTLQVYPTPSEVGPPVNAAMLVDRNTKHTTIRAFATSGGFFGKKREEGEEKGKDTELKNTNDNDNIQAFWREKNLSGEALSDGGLEPSEFPINMTYDLTTPGGHPAIGGHIAGSRMDSFSLRRAKERKQLVLHHLSKLFGDEALKPIDYVEKNWCDELYIGGCPIQYLTPGVMSCKHFMQQPFIRVYWAGTEAALSWFGYMNGAVQAGNVAALETLYQLRPQALTALDLIQVHRCFPVRKPPSGVPWWLLWISLGLIGVAYIAYRLHK